MRHTTATLHHAPATRAAAPIVPGVLGSSSTAVPTSVRTASGAPTSPERSNSGSSGLAPSSGPGSGSDVGAAKPPDGSSAFEPGPAGHVAQVEADLFDQPRDPSHLVGVVGNPGTADGAQ